MIRKAPTPTSQAQTAWPYRLLEWRFDCGTARFVKGDLNAAELDRRVGYLCSVHNVALFQTALGWERPNQEPLVMNRQQEVGAPLMFRTAFRLNLQLGGWIIRCGRPLKRSARAASPTASKCSLQQP